MRCFHRNTRCGERWRLLCSSRTFKKSEQKLRSLSSSTRFPAFWFFVQTFSVPDKHGSQAARQHELGKQQQARRRFWGQREYQGESFARKMFFLAGEVPEDGPSSRGGAHLAQCRTIVHTWHLSIFLHSRFLSHGNFTLKKCVNLCQNSLTTKHQV